MGWRVVERRIGKAGGIKQREARQREWDRKYGEDRWAVGYLIDGAFMLQEQALEHVYHRSYEAHFAAHPEDLEERCLRPDISLEKWWQNEKCLAVWEDGERERER